MTNQPDGNTKGHKVYLPTPAQLRESRDLVKSNWKESTRKRRLVTPEPEPFALEPLTILMPDGSVMQ